MPTPSDKQPNHPEKDKFTIYFHPATMTSWRDYPPTRTKPTRAWWITFGIATILLLAAAPAILHAFTYSLVTEPQQPGIGETLGGTLLAIIVTPIVAFFGAAFVAFIATAPDSTSPPADFSFTQAIVFLLFAPVAIFNALVVTALGQLVIHFLG